MVTPKHFFFATLLILASIHVEAREVRERESFSKFTNANDNDDTEKARVVPHTTEEALPTAQEEALKKQEDQEQEPAFLPQTQNGYGLYGHEEMFEDTPATTTATTRDRPSRTAMPDDSFYSYPNGDSESSNNYYNDRRSDNYFDKDAYVTGQREQARDTYLPEEQNFDGNARLQDSSYTTATGSRATTNDRNNYYTGGNRYGAGKQEGMSDTRFMENGKYFYDVDNEEKYYQNRYKNSRPGYSTQGYYGNGDRTNNVNLYEQQFDKVDRDSMGRFQDQEEFQESQDDEFVP
ncbi:protein E6-like [Rhodamnia argentea]|uniref:Protein E6-like n=1 Tax=Rhodamnia argentea TaxID=178133 RepID=A0A8B8MRE1_9MYRT|nr:protein E6-like [Rhodamnia argentea]